MYINLKEVKTKDYYVDYYYKRTRHNSSLLLNTMNIIDRIVPTDGMAWRDFLRMFEYEVKTCELIAM